LTLQQCYSQPHCNNQPHCDNQPHRWVSLLAFPARVLLCVHRWVALQFFVNVHCWLGAQSYLTLSCLLGMLFVTHGWVCRFQLRLSTAAVAAFTLRSCSPEAAVGAAAVAVADDRCWSAVAHCGCGCFAAHGVMRASWHVSSVRNLHRSATYAA
jgi:hypothetical protein